MPDRPRTRLIHLLALAAGLGVLADPHPASAGPPPPPPQQPEGPGSTSSDPGAPGAPSALANSLASRDLGHLQWRNIGPGGVGGRIVDFAADPADTRTIYAGTAQGGVWKTENGGLTWQPVFDHEGSSSIGGVAVAKTNPDVVWVGTGEANGRNLVSTSWGDGVYRSNDGGETWTHAGLALSQQIGRIRVHPDDEETVYVPVVGSLWHDSPELNAARGLWRTTDGGTTWEKILSAGDDVGFVDLDLDPRDPHVMYAASWQRERVDWSWLPVGDDGGLFRTTDGGETWERLARGLPTSGIGRVGVSVCASDPDVVYSIFEGPEGGVFRSDDRGASWERRNARVRGSHWYSQIRCDPRDPDLVYALQTAFMVSHDGGRTFADEMADKPVHVDHHALWIDPADPDHLVLGNDGGIYTSRDRGGSWRFVQLPLTQFFEIGVGMQEPFYYVCGGAQDNSSHCGPSQTRARDGIVNDDWFATSGGDGFYARLDPTDPSIIYSESQNGGLVRVDSDTGERKRIKPADPEELSPGPSDGAPGDIDEFRWNWSAPVLVSRWDPATIYLGAQALLKSPDRGDSWEIVSPDLTRALTYEHQMNDFGTIRVIAESPLREGLLAVGTDDGLVQITEDGGATWRTATPMPGVPELGLVRRVVLSSHDPRTLYVASSSHEYNDFTPYLLKSTDLGRTWESIAANLPDGEPIRAFAEHPGSPGLLFVGTERGVWASVDGGARWISIRNNLPTVAVHDMVVHPREDDLVIGTHGRGIWILDGVGVLATVADGAPRDTAWVARPRPTLELDRYDRGRGSRGSTYFRAPNPPTGVRIDYWLPDGTSDPVLGIRDAEGRPVRTLTLEGDAGEPGLHRIWWDMRYDPTWEAPPEPPGEREGGRFGRGRGTVESPRVLPGTYHVRLADRGTTSSEPFEIRADPMALITDRDRRYRHDLLRSLSHILATARAATASTRALSDALDRAEEAMADGTDAADPPELPDRLRRARERLESTLDGLNDVSSAASRAWGGLESSTSTPARQDVQFTGLAYERLAARVEELREMASEEVPAILGRLGDRVVAPAAAPVVTLPDAARPPERR